MKNEKLSDNKIIIFGSSGHARSIAVILELLNFEIVGFVDSYLPIKTRILNYSIIGDENSLENCKERFGTNKIIIGIGDITNRRKVLDKIKLINPGLVFPSIISPTAFVAKYSNIGQGAVIFNNSFVNVEVDIGEFCVINSSSIIEHNTTIKDFCNISPGANIGGDVKIGANTFIGSSATVIQKKSIGNSSVIGAGAVVTKNIPDNVLAVGVPAEIKFRGYDNAKILS